MGKLLLLAGLAAMVLAVVSLFTPKAGFFLKKKTRFKACIGYIIIAAFCMGVGNDILERGGKSDNSAAQLPAAIAEASTINTQADTPIIFEYREQTSTPRKTRHGRVDGGLIYIYPADQNGQLTSENIASTCVAAAKFYINKYSQEYGEINNMLVVVTDMPYELDEYKNDIYYGKIGKLGQCHFHHTRTDGWKLISFEASDRNTTTAEKQIEALWFKLRKKYTRRNRVAEHELKKEIAKQLNLNLEDINLTPVPPNKIDMKNFGDIAAHGPVK